LFIIKIKRPKAPDFLLDPNGPWIKEIERAKAHYSNGSTEAFEFKLYNDARVKEALKRVFIKCAYCESSYGAVYDGDVEHFRPKGKVKEKDPPTPGYFWLANDWDNLFLSCQHCNQRRKHILVGEEELESHGKMDQFPLDPETVRVHECSAEFENEEKARLLINPCKDLPEEHFQYERENSVMIPLTTKGETSIRVYVLHRPILVQERKKQMLKLFKQMAIAKNLLEQMNNQIDNNNIKNLFEMALESVMDFTKETEVYAGMSRYFVRQFLQQNNLL
jgi:5-methylcytosine-specific restriction endonuclease McrA